MEDTINITSYGAYCSKSEARQPHNCDEYQRTKKSSNIPDSGTKLPGQQDPWCWVASLGWGWRWR